MSSNSESLRHAALDYAVPTVTTLAGARAAVEAIGALQQHRQVEVVALQDIHRPWGNGTPSRPL